MDPYTPTEETRVGLQVGVEKLGLIERDKFFCQCVEKRLNNGAYFMHLPAYIGFTHSQ